VTMVDRCMVLSEAQTSELKALAAVRHTSEAALIDAAIERLRLDRVDPAAVSRAAWARETEFFASLIAQGPVPGGRAWTREELHER
jgi:hypothetical protein